MTLIIDQFTYTQVDFMYARKGFIAFQFKECSYWLDGEEYIVNSGVAYVTPDEWERRMEW